MIPTHCACMVQSAIWLIVKGFWAATHPAQSWPTFYSDSSIKMKYRFSITVTNFFEGKNTAEFLLDGPNDQLKRPPWGRSPAHSFWQICTSVWMWMDPQAAPESTCLDPHPTTHGAHPPTSHWGGLIKPGQLTSVHTVARHSFLLSFESQSHCLWNESNIHPLQQALWKSRNFSLCGKGGILGGRSG